MLFWIAFVVFPRTTVLVTYLMGNIQNIFPNETPFWVDFFGVLIAPLGWAAYQLYKAGYPDWAIIGLVVFQILEWLAVSPRRRE